MRHIKTVIVIVVLLGSILTGCYSRVGSFPLRQSVENMSKIELLMDFTPVGEGTEFTVLQEISKENHETFINELLGLECRKVFGDMPTDFGVIAIRITYVDGNIEMIGHGNNAYFTEDRNYYGAYYFQYEDFKELFSHYVDESLLPEVG